MGEVIGVLVVLFLLVVLVALPILAMVQASRARSEAEAVRRELDRLERTLRGLVEIAARTEPTPPPIPAAPPPPPAAAESPAAAPSPPPVVLSHPVLVPERHRAPAAARERESPETLENFLGGRVFLVVGVLVALLGLGWFLKVAIDRNWIGPGARVALGLAAGVAALLGGERLRAKGWAVFGQGVMGGGLGALYITTFFACVRYGFIERPATYGAMALLTAGAAALAILRDAPLLAYLGFLGGFLAPAVLTTGEDRILGLSAWIAVLDVGVLVVAARRPWRGLDLMAAIASALYFAFWVDRHFQPHRVGDGSLALCLMASLALAAALAPPILRREAPHPLALAAAMVCGGFAVAGGGSILHPGHRRALGAGVAVLAAVYAAAAHVVATRCAARQAAMLLLSLAVGAFAISVPFVFEGRGLAPAWSAAGLGLLVLGARGAPAPIAIGGALMLVLAAGESLFGGRWDHDPGMARWMNAAVLCSIAPPAAMVAGGVLLTRSGRRTEAGALVVAGCWLLAAAAGVDAWLSLDSGRTSRIHPMLPGAAFAASCVLLASVALFRRGPEVLRTLLALPFLAAFALAAISATEGPEGPFTPVLRIGFLLGLGTAAAGLAAGALAGCTGGRVVQVAALACLFVLGTAEIFEWGDRRPLVSLSRQEAQFHAQVAVSVAWALYAAALLGAGFLLRRTEFRWTAIVLFGLTLAKVLLFDTARLDAAYRILSFLLLGGLLVAASFLYQKRRSAGT